MEIRLLHKCASMCVCVTIMAQRGISNQASPLLRQLFESGSQGGLYEMYNKSNVCITKSKSHKLGMPASCALLDPLIHVLSSSLLRRPLMNSSRISIPLAESTSSKGRCWYRSLPHAHAMLEISWAPACCFTMPNHTQKALCKWSSHQSDLPTVNKIYHPNCVSI